MTKDELAGIGRELYGPEWKGKMASEIGWSRWTVYRWAAGKTAIHRAAEEKIRSLAQEYRAGRHL